MAAPSSPKEQQMALGSSARKGLQQGEVSNFLWDSLDPNKEIRLAADASGYGVGCVLSHVMEDGSEKPIAFASRTLNEAEKNYSQLEKEALSIVWGIKKFMFYLEGRNFTLITDHKPLTTIFHPEKAVPVTAAARIQRWGKR